MTEKNTIPKPTPAPASQTCCGAKPRASRVEKATMAKAGASWKPISERTVENTIDVVHRPPTGIALPEAGDELHDARYREQGVVAILRGAPVARLRRAELGEQADETAEAAEFDPGDHAGGDYRGREHQGLQHAHKARRAHAAQHNIDEDQRAERPHGHHPGNGAARKNLHQVTGRSELKPEEGDGEKKGNQEQDRSDQRAAEIVDIHFDRGDVAETAAQHPLPRHDQRAHERNGDRAERQRRGLESIPENCRRQADHHPPGE